MDTDPDCTDREQSPNTDHDAALNTGSEAELKLNPESSPEMDPEPSPKKDPEPSPKKDPEPSPKKEPVPEVDPEPAAEVEPAPEVDPDGEPDPEIDPESHFRPRFFLRHQLMAVRNRIFGVRTPLSIEQMMAEGDLSNPIFVFASDLVQYAMRFHLRGRVRQWLFDPQFTHSSTTTHFGYRARQAIAACLQNREVSIQAVCYRYFPRGCRNEGYFRNIIEILRGATRDRMFSSTRRLLSFCCFVAQFCAVAYRNGLDTSPYRALDIICWNIVEFIIIYFNSDPEEFWKSLPVACRDLRFRAHERRLFNFLVYLITQRAEHNANWNRKPQ